ncbi:MAG: 4-phosphoerythronate dehydrogenase [Pseudomonadota bacterium]|nr:4-phosphoerythronate dehydrogenase [Gammaproteobacteria bacterium]MDQ3582552.1 4-phosphoerythronate dehydrogenase [Pseudomonadota bacterium]
MKVIADPNIAAVEEAFSDLGDVQLVPGREWTPFLVRHADVLLVRSVTRVDARLLQDSRVRFVGTATSGVDHIDRTYLSHRGIAFAAALGSNAQAVAEYVVSAVLVLAEARGLCLRETTAGVIGCGQVGSRVVRLFSTVGIRCVINDPPLADSTGDARYRPLDEALGADIVTLHVPLANQGPYPTQGLIGREALSRMKSDVILINTARGGIVNESALKRRLARQDHMATVIDCWEGEPHIDPELASRSTLSTPHIAGYSADAKLRATSMLHAAACELFAISGRWSASSPMGREITLVSQSPEDAQREAVLLAYDVRDDDRTLRACLSGARGALGRSFDALRANYRERREFSAHAVHVGPDRAPVCSALADLGFRIRSALTHD